MSFCHYRNISYCSNYIFISQYLWISSVRIFQGSHQKINNFNLSGLKQQVWWMAMKRKGLENSKKRSESFSVQMRWKRTWNTLKNSLVLRQPSKTSYCRKWKCRFETSLNSASSLPKPCMQVALFPNWIIARSCAKAMKCFLAIACRCAFCIHI